MVRGRETMAEGREKRGKFENYTRIYVPRERIDRTIAAKGNRRRDNWLVRTSERIH